MIDQVFFLGLFLFILGAGMLGYVFRYVVMIMVRVRVPGVVSQTRQVSNGGGPNKARTTFHDSEISYCFNGQEYTVEVTTGSGAILHHSAGQSVTVAVNEHCPEKGVVVSGPIILLRAFVLMFGVGLAIVGSVILLAKLGLVTVNAV